MRSGLCSFRDFSIALWSVGNREYQCRSQERRIRPNLRAIHVRQRSEEPLVDLVRVAQGKLIEGHALRRQVGATGISARQVHGEIKLTSAARRVLKGGANVEPIQLVGAQHRQVGPQVGQLGVP